MRSFGVCTSSTSRKRPAPEYHREFGCMLGFMVMTTRFVCPGYTRRVMSASKGA